MKRRSKRATLFQLFQSFFAIGLLTFGGGLAMLPLIRRELVDRRRWLTDSDFVNIIAITQAVPGAIAVNAAAFMGYRIAGLPGAATSLVGVALPSFAVMLIIAVWFHRLGRPEVLEAAFKGIRPGVAALVLWAAIGIARNSLKDVIGLGIAALSLFGLLYLNLHPIAVISAAALVGMVVTLRR